MRGPDRRRNVCRTHHGKWRNLRGSDRSVDALGEATGSAPASGILDNRQIRRLPVVRDGHLVGIVSRGDLIRALAAMVQPPAPESLVSEATPKGRVSAPGLGRTRARPRRRREY